MPTLMLRHLSPDLIRQVREYARSQQIGLTTAAVELLEKGVQSYQDRARGANVLNASLSAEERSARAKRAVAAREAKRQAR